MGKYGGGGSEGVKWEQGGGSLVCADAPAILSNSVSSHPPLMCHCGPTRLALHSKAADCVRPSAAAAAGLSVKRKHTEQ